MHVTKWPSMEKTICKVLRSVQAKNKGLSNQTMLAVTKHLIYNSNTRPSMESMKKLEEKFLK